MKVLLAVAMTLAMVGCTTAGFSMKNTSAVVSTGEGSLMITELDYSMDATPDAVKAGLFQKASTFCGLVNKKFVLVNSTQSEPDNSSAQATITFNCK